ncbi:MAG: peptidylprolyl isomerase [Alphaproteobacteria bacterium]|nr:MAG: peptidylprolyl isomerase [Alphaproteobacteria bacterium]
MASFFRAKGTNAVVWVILGLLILGLAGFGVRSFRSTISSVGKVGDEKISVGEYARALDNQMRALSQQLGRPLTGEEARAFGLDRQVLQAMLARAALDAEAKRIGLSVGDKRLRDALVAIPAFHGADGRFDPATYKLVLKQSGTNPAEFEAGMRKDLARALLTRAISGGILRDPVHVRTVLAFLRQSRDATLIRVDAAALAEPVPEPDEATLKTWFEAHKDSFRTPEIKRLTVALLAPEDVLDQIEVSEDEIRARWQENPDYHQPERRLVERVVFPDEAAAREARKRLDAGEASFEQILAERGLKPEDADLGEVTREELSEEAAKAVFAAREPGTVVGPVRSRLGWALFRVNGALDAVEVPLEQVRDKIRREIALERAGDLIAERAPEIEDLLAAGATLEEVAKEKGLRLETIDWHPGLGEGIAADPAFRARAEAVTRDDYPEIDQLESGGIFALRLEEVVPPRERSLEEVRDEAVAAWKAEELMRRLAARADEIAAQLANGADPAAMGLATRKVEGLQRGRPIPGTPPDLAARLFALEAPGALARAEGAGVIWLARLDAIHPFDPESEQGKALIAALEPRLGQEIGQDVLDRMVALLEDDIGVTIDPAALSAVVSRLGSGGAR